MDSRLAKEIDVAAQEEIIGHAWQAHRTKCLELAVQARAPLGEVLEWAQKFSAYILTKTEIELKHATERANARH